jgi:glycerophosphoryl diester phosphodiesterase
VNCIAHRAFAGVAPENTLPAVRAAVAGTAGAGDGGSVPADEDTTGVSDAEDAATVDKPAVDGIEVDVRRCGSGELVVCHDETVDRVTDATGTVGEFSAAELADLSVAGSGAGIPTFDAVLDAVPPAVTVHAELKERVGADVEALAAEADPPVVVSSFDAGALADIEEFPTAWLVTAAEGAVPRARDLGAAALHAPVDVCDAALVDRAAEAGLTVNVWTVTDPDQTRQLRDLGVDGVIADYPACCPSRR